MILPEMTFLSPGDEPGMMLPVVASVPDAEISTPSLFS